MKIAIITAMEKELASVYNKLGHAIGNESVGGMTVYRFSNGNNDVYLLNCGIGEIYAAAATQLVIDRYEVELIVNVGYVGSLTPSLKAGDVTFVERVVHHQFDLSGIDDVKRGQYGKHSDCYFYLDRQKVLALQHKLPKKLPFVTLASGDAFISDKKEKEKLVKDFAADICDMELAGIAIVAKKNGVPVMSLKLVSDNADENAAQSYNEFIKNGMQNIEGTLGILLENVR
ncbi:MAG: 5'-methylthioadenosine/S-adenosylhomocysteine nucleosidase [Christensenellales bacterium]